MTDLIKNQIVKRFLRLCERICVTDCIAILHDTDPDGICSAVITAKAIERLRARPVDYIIHQDHGDVGITEQTITFLKKNKVNVLITVDKPIDQDPLTVQRCEEICEILVFDHHKYINDISSERCFFIKPHMFAPPEIDDSQYPTSRMVYDLFYPAVDIKDTDWIMAVGVIADAAYKTWKFAIDGVFERYRITKTEDIYKSQLAGVSKIITSTAIVAPQEIDNIFETIYHAKDYQDVLNSPLKKHQEKFDHELTYWIEHVKTKAELYPKQNTLIYYVTPKYSIKSVLSTLLSIKQYPGWTIICAEEQPKTEMINISIRNQSGKVNCIELIRTCTEGLEGASGGGHLPAVGGRIKKKDYKIFHERLLEKMGVTR